MFLGVVDSLDLTGRTILTAKKGEKETNVNQFLLPGMEALDFNAYLVNPCSLGHLFSSCIH